MRRSSLLLGTLAATFALAPGQADARRKRSAAITSVTAERADEILRARGWAPETHVLDDGEPYLSFTHQGDKMALYLYDCVGGECGAVQLVAGFSLDEPATLETVNEWNRTKRFSRVYMQPEGAVFIEMDLDLAGGVMPGAIDDWFEIWNVSVPELKRHLGY